MATNSRESRRRKILERGSDRLALITGRVQTFPPPSSFASDSHNECNTDSSKPLVSHDLVPQSLPSQQEATASHMDEASDTGTDAGQSYIYQGGSSAEPVLHSSGTSVEPVGIPPLDVGSSLPSSVFSSRPVDSSISNPLDVSNNLQSSPLSSTDQHSSISNPVMERHLEPQKHQRKIFTPNQISSAITASERIRLFCSVTVAVLVALSYLGFPLLGSNIIKGIISFRPLYLVLLTNLTVVFSRLLLENPRGAINGDSDITSAGAYGWAEHLSKALEVGFVMQKVIDAVIMDCSIYAIIVICGLSLAWQFS